MCFEVCADQTLSLKAHEFVVGELLLVRHSFYLGINLRFRSTSWQGGALHDLSLQLIAQAHDTRHSFQHVIDAYFHLKISSFNGSHHSITDFPQWSRRMRSYHKILFTIASDWVKKRRSDAREGLQKKASPFCGQSLHARHRARGILSLPHLLPHPTCGLLLPLPSLSNHRARCCAGN